MIGVGSKCKPINIEQVREWFIQTAKNIAYDYGYGFDVMEDCG